MEMAFIVGSQAESLDGVVSWFGQVLAENQDHSIEIFKSFLVVLEKNISKPKVLEVAAAVCCQLPPYGYVGQRIFKGLFGDAKVGNESSADACEKLIRLCAVTGAVFDMEIDPYIAIMNAHVAKTYPPSVQALFTFMARNLVARPFEKPKVSYNADAKPFVPRVSGAAPAATVAAPAAAADDFNEFVEDPESFDLDVIGQLQDEDAMAQSQIETYLAASSEAEAKPALPGLRASAPCFKPASDMEDEEMQDDLVEDDLVEQTLQDIKDPVIQGIIMDLMQQGLDSEIPRAISNYRASKKK